MNTTQAEEYSTPTVTVLGSLSDLTKTVKRRHMSWAKDDRD